MMNIRFLIVCLRQFPPKLLRNCLDQPKLNLQRNSVIAELGGWLRLPGFPPRVPHLFYLVWGDNFVTGDFLICRHSAAWRREGTARWSQSRIIAHYEIIVSKLEPQKNINVLIKTISPAGKNASTANLCFWQ